MFGQKVNCDFCGKTVKLRKAFELTDGYICSDCMGSMKLSHDMNISQVKAIRHQRRLSREREKEFVVTREIGEGNKTCIIDERHRLFMIDDPKKWRVSHPDIYSFKDIMNVQIDIKDEDDGYDFEVYIQLNHAAVDEIVFSLSSMKPKVRYDDLYLQLVKKGEILSDVLMSEELDDSVWICPHCQTRNNNRFCSHCGRPKTL